jgi:hypothetical protein
VDPDRGLLSNSSPASDALKRKPDRSSYQGPFPFASKLRFGSIMAEQEYPAPELDMAADANTNVQGHAEESKPSSGMAGSVST